MYLCGREWSADYGQAFESKAKLEHVAHSREEHQSGSSGSLNNPFAGLPFPVASASRFRLSGHRLTATADRSPRAWMLLAQASEMPLHL
jgi:hypothetical protein